MNNQRPHKSYLCNYSLLKLFSSHDGYQYYSLDILTFIILYDNLIPISLIVTTEVVKFQQTELINFNLAMCHARLDSELRYIECVFSDKTGTLTCNDMEFRCCSVVGYAYTDMVDGNRGGEGNDGKDGWRTFVEMRCILDLGGLIHLWMLVRVELVRLGGRRTY
jgi:phospholipid-transporting ATPase